MGILTVGVVTLPFAFEGRPRMKKAMEGKRLLSENVDTIITIPNDRLTGHVASIGKKFKMKQAFEEVNNVLLQAVTGITNLITRPGVINLDFADVKTIMSIRGASLMGMGIGKGEDRVREATEKAMKNPLLTHDIKGAKGLLFNITGNDNLEYEDFIEANQIISEYVDEEECEYMVGTVLDESIPEDTVYVTVVATGFQDNEGELVAPKLPQSNRLVNSLQDRETRTAEKERVVFVKEEKTTQENDDYVTKEMNSIFDTLDMPGFMRNLGRK
jgi:cell division protein FtsZ